MTEILRDRDIPVRRHGRQHYPFDRMSIGDSFVLPCVVDDLKVVANRLRAAAWNFSRRHPGVRFASRTVYEDGKLVGIGLWRIP